MTKRKGLTCFIMFLVSDYRMFSTTACTHNVYLRQVVICYRCDYSFKECLEDILRIIFISLFISYEI